MHPLKQAWVALARQFLGDRAFLGGLGAYSRKKILKFRVQQVQFPSFWGGFFYHIEYDIALPEL